VRDPFLNQLILLILFRYSSIFLFHSSIYFPNDRFSSIHIPKYLAVVCIFIPLTLFPIPFFYVLLLGFDFINTMFDLFLLSFILFFLHQFSIYIIAVVKANLESAINAISSAKTRTTTPNILLSNLTSLFITTLKKNGEVLFPCGHPQLI
jgi:hypothetical protein